MHRPGQFTRQDPMDLPLSFDAVLPGEDFRDDQHAEMSLALRSCPGMAGVTLTVIDDIEPTGL